MLNEGQKDEMSHTCGNYAVDAPEGRPVRLSLGQSLFGQPFEKRGQRVDRKGEDDRGVLFCCDFNQRLQIPEL